MSRRRSRGLTRTKARPRQQHLSPPPPHRAGPGFPPIDCAEPAAGLVLSVEVPAPEEDGMKVHPLEEDDGTQQCDDTFSTSDSVDAFRADAPGTQARRRVLYVPVAISEASISL